MSDPCEEAKAGLRNASDVRVQVQWELREETKLMEEYKADMEGAASEKDRAVYAAQMAADKKQSAAEKLKWKKEVLADDPNDSWKKADVREAKAELSSATKALQSARSRAQDAKTTHTHFKRKYENKSAYVKEKKNYWNRLSRSIKSWESKVERNCK
ncbi:MAG: hypothetical protein AAF940_05170 [Pseudomonadota bacterium]